MNEICIFYELIMHILQVLPPADANRDIFHNICIFLLSNFVSETIILDYNKGVLFNVY